MILLALARAYEDEDDIQKLLPLAFAPTVFFLSLVDVVLPGRFRYIGWIWKPSDLSEIRQTGDLLSCGLAAGNESIG